MLSKKLTTSKEKAFIILLVVHNKQFAGQERLYMLKWKPKILMLMYQITIFSTLHAQGKCAPMGNCTFEHT